MELSILPKTPELLSQLTEIFLKQDKEIVDELNKRKDDNGTCGVQFIGFIKVKEKDKEEPTEVIIYIDDDFWNRRNINNKDIPCESIISRKDGGNHIVINQLAYDYYFNSTTHYLTVGSLAHEIGHLLCGHLDPSKREEQAAVSCQNRDPNHTHIAWVDREDKDSSDVAGKIIISLLDGHYGDEIELEEDIVAVQLVGISPVLATHTIHSKSASSIAAKMIHHNRVHELIRLLQTDPDMFITDRFSEFDIQILPMDEIKALKEQMKKEEVCDR